MNTDLKSTKTPKGEQINTEHETQSVSREKASTFNVQTGLSAGRLTEWYPTKYWDEWIGRWLDRF